jgi:hypothetical protein
MLSHHFLPLDAGRAHSRPAFHFRRLIPKKLLTPAVHTTVMASQLELHHITSPPLTCSTCPVTKPAASLAR